jgi:hypothetical protein
MPTQELSTGTDAGDTSTALAPLVKQLVLIARARRLFSQDELDEIFERFPWLRDA